MSAGRSSAGNSDLLDDENLDAVLLAIENPVRRKIIRRLSKESGYQLQMSRELGFSQQLVAKHLDAMEGSGLVSSMMEESPHGPKRKEYLLNKGISLSLDFAPNLFRARVYAYDYPVTESSQDSNDFFRTLGNVVEHPQASGKMRPLGSLISEIDKRMATMEDERSVLLYIRHLAMTEVAKAISGMPITWDEKKALYQLINERETSVEGISKSLKLREDWVRTIIANLQSNL
ncbi:MAG: ArsR family transcriptional regulator [Thaumarchaeota archaeon]|nr:ArsR family transcriptional regulator [Nitrososphaerota archaeon]